MLQQHNKAYIVVTFCMLAFFSGRRSLAHARAADSITLELHTEGNHIKDSAGRLWQGRGANLQDTRSCESCLIHHDVKEVLRRVDALTDDWHATFVRLTMENYHSSGVLDDPQYLTDLTTIVDHIGSKKNVYVMLGMWHDPTLDGNGWPTAAAAPIWQRLVSTFGNRPYVMYGLSNEPERNLDGSQDAGVWHAMNALVEVIRAAERDQHVSPHIISVQGTRDWARDLTYYMSHPIAAGGGENIVYETHIYDVEKDFIHLLDRPAKVLPVIIGEFGPIQDMTLRDCTRLIERAEQLDVPYLAWTFHSSCAPNLIENLSQHTCSLGEPLVPTPWGQMLREALMQASKRAAKAAVEP